MSSNLIKHTQYKGIRKVLIDNFNTKVIKAIKDINPDTILDAGCGEGFVSILVKKKIANISMTGMDLSENAIQYAKNNCNAVSFICGSIYEIPFPDNSFDLVLCSEVLEHLKDPDRALKEINRVSSKHIILTVPLEPFFSLGNFITLKHMRTFGNHPEHINHWNINSIKCFAKKEIQINKCYSVFPWIVLEGKKEY